MKKIFKPNVIKVLIYIVMKIKVKFSRFRFALTKIMHLIYIMIYFL